MLFGCPSSPCFARSFPPRGSLDVRQGFTFLPKKMKFAEFFFRQGEAAKRQYENLSSIVCLRRHFPRYRRFFRAFLSQEKKRKRGKQGGNGKQVTPVCLKNFNQTMLRPSFVQSSALSTFPPGGRLKTMLKVALGDGRLRQKMKIQTMSGSYFPADGIG